MGIIAATSTTPFVCGADDQVINVKLDGLCALPQRTDRQDISFSLYNTMAPVTSFAALNTCLQKATGVGAWLTKFNAQVCDTYAATGITMYDVNHPQLRTQSFAAHLNNNTAATGEKASVALPNHNVAIINFYTPFRGSASRGRVVVGPMPTAGCVPAAGHLGDEWNAATLTALAAIFDTNDAGVVTVKDATNQIWQLCINTSGGNPKDVSTGKRAPAKLNPVRLSQRVPDFDYQTQTYRPAGGQLVVILEPVTTVSVLASVQNTRLRGEHNAKRHHINQGA